MKKIISLLALALAATTPALAQWNTNATPACVYSTADKNGDYHACSIKAARTPDKKTWLSWKTWEVKWVGKLKTLAVRTYLQLLDRDGVAQFEEPIMVNDHVTPSWWSNYSLCVAADGSAIVTVADGRTEEANLTPEEGDTSATCYSFCPAIYKIDQEGNFLWGLDGIDFPDYTDSPFTNAYVVGEDTYFLFNSNSNGADDFINIVRIDDDGTLGWEDIKKVDGLHAQIVPSLDGDFLLFDDCPDGARVTRLNRDFESVWGESVIYDPYKYDGQALNQYKLASDGQGGAAVAFVRNMGQFAHNIRVQHIYADGSLGFGLEGLDAANTEDGDFDYCGVAVSPETEEILVDFESQLTTGYHVMLQKFTFDGDYLFDDQGVSIARKSQDNNYAFARVGIGSIEDGGWIVCYRDVAGYGAKNSFVIRRYDKEGTQVWTRTIGRDLDVDGVNMFVEPEATYLFYREYAPTKAPGVKIFRIGSDGKYDVTYQDNVVPGDVNGDKTVDVADIALIIDVMAAGATIPDASASGAADVNKDGSVDVADISAVIDAMAGKASE